jgi:hypothetical protein
MIIVRLAELIMKPNLLSEVSRRGLHDYLGFGGRVVLSTIMPDELIDELQSKDYLRFIRDLRPDATMVPDNYTYMDDPLYLSWSQTIRLVRNALSFLELDIPAIGLIKGATPEQVGCRQDSSWKWVMRPLPCQQGNSRGLTFWITSWRPRSSPSRNVG